MFCKNHRDDRFHLISLLNLNSRIRAGQSRENLRPVIKYPLAFFIHSFYIKTSKVKESSNMISAILLAAGQSQRMGRFKQLLVVAGKTFVERCIDTLLASRIDEVIVVTGHRESDVRRVIARRPVRFAHNPNYMEGMSTSIKRGVEAVSPEADAVMIALVDQPLIEVDVIDLLIAVYSKDRPLIVVPRHKGRSGHPIIMDMKLREEILSMDDAKGLKPVRDAHSHEAVYIEVESESILIDFDLPEDYERINEADR